MQTCRHTVFILLYIYDERRHYFYSECLHLLFGDGDGAFFVTIDVEIYQDKLPL